MGAACSFARDPCWRDEMARGNARCKSGVSLCWQTKHMTKRWRLKITTAGQPRTTNHSLQCKIVMWWKHTGVNTLPLKTRKCRSSFASRKKNQLHSNFKDYLKNQHVRRIAELREASRKAAVN